MMQMVNSNQEVKPNSLRRALELLFYIPLDNDLRCSIAFLIERKSTSKNDASNEQQVKINIKHKCKQQQVEQSKREQSQIQKICFEVRAQNSTSPSSPHEGFHYPLRIFSQKSLHKKITSSTKIGMHNFNSKSFTQEVA